MLSRSFAPILGLLLVLPFISASLQADEPPKRARVGELASSQLSTEHPYPRGSAQTYEIHHPGATYIKVHFSRFELAPGDWLEIRLA